MSTTPHAPSEGKRRRERQKERTAERETAGSTPSRSRCRSRSRVARWRRRRGRTGPGPRNRRLRCLVTNDDGINSEGLRGSPHWPWRPGLEVVVAAPVQEASGASASITAVEEDRAPRRRAPHRSRDWREPARAGRRRAAGLHRPDGDAGGVRPTPDMVLWASTTVPNTVMPSSTPGPSGQHSPRGQLSARAMAVAADAQTRDGVRRRDRAVGHDAAALGDRRRGGPAGAAVFAGVETRTCWTPTRQRRPRRGEGAWSGRTWPGSAPCRRTWPSGGRAMSR